MENKRVESAARLAVGQRNYRRARDRALARLAQAYPDQYKELMEEEKERDALENKKWNHLSDSPFYGVDYDPPSKASASTTTSREGGNQGNDGGEA
jgi:uncharacterized iron-regulated membrane protein